MIKHKTSITDWYYHEQIKMGGGREEGGGVLDPPREKFNFLNSLRSKITENMPRISGKL